MNPRQRMRASNRKAVLWLLENGYDDIWLKAHTKRLDLIYAVGEWYRALDLWNLFDGICINEDGEAIFFQVKTNAWAKAQPIKDFLEDKKDFKVLVINVRGQKRKWDILVRNYESK